jgi:MFS transporter, DHA2 family, multidrug resistance protein
MSSAALPRSAAKPGVNPLLIAALVSFGTLFEALDSTALSVALSTTAANLGATAEESDSILTAYLVANAAVMPLSAWAAVYFGRKPYFIFCVILFTLTSLLCATAWSVESLLFFRILQGAAAAGNAASESSIIADSFPPEKRGLGFAIYGMAIVVGPTLGPMFGGWVTENSSWRWIFWSNVPVGMIVIGLLYMLLQDPPAVKEETKKLRSKGARIDYAGLLLGAIGLSALQVFMDQGQSEDWLYSPLIRWSLAAAVICLFVLPIWELTRKDPILDFRLFKGRHFTLGFTLSFVTGAVLFGGTTLFPLWLQQSFGYTATWAGLALGIGGLGVFFLMPVSAALSSKVPTAWMVGPGMVAVAIGLGFTSEMYADYSFWQVSMIRLGHTIGLAFLIVPLQSYAYIGTPENRSEQVGAFLNLARNMGGSIGTALGTTLLERSRQSYREQITDSTSLLRPEFRELVDQGFGGCLACVSRNVDALATLLAYNHVFFVFCIVTALSVPLIFFLKGKPEAGQVG